MKTSILEYLTEQKTDDSLSDLITFFEDLKQNNRKLTEEEINHIIKFLYKACAEVAAYYYGDV